MELRDIQPSNKIVKQMVKCLDLRKQWRNKYYLYFKMQDIELFRPLNFI